MKSFKALALTTLFVALAGLSPQRVQAQATPSDIAVRLRPVAEGVVTAFDAGTAKRRWAVAPVADGPALPLPPEPAEEFPELAEQFNMRAMAQSTCDALNLVPLVDVY